MDWFSTALDAALRGDVDIEAMVANNELYFAFISEVTPTTGFGGDEFMADITGRGGILHTEAELTNESLANAALGSTDPSVVVDDPGGGSTATHVVLYQKTGDQSTARLLASERITDLTFDGTNDTLNLPSPILQLQ